MYAGQQQQYWARKYTQKIAEKENKKSLSSATNDKIDSFVRGQSDHQRDII
jgi:hypothetical protein